jgi:hypothetical protein
MANPVSLLPSFFYIIISGLILLSVIIILVKGWMILRSRMGSASNSIAAIQQDSKPSVAVDAVRS